MYCLLAKVVSAWKFMGLLDSLAAGGFLGTGAEDTDRCFFELS
jgi:hypothetical protein